MMSFITNLMNVKKDRVLKNIVQKTIKRDPEGAAEAELRKADLKLIDLEYNLEDATENYVKLSKQLESAIKTYTEQKDIVLRQQDHLQKSDINQFNDTLRDLESQASAIEELSISVDGAKELMDLIQTHCDESRSRIDESKQIMHRAHQDYRRAAIHRKIEEERAKVASKLDGITTDVSGVDALVSEIKSATTTEILALESSKYKTKVLTHNPDDPNGHIASAMQAVAVQTRSSTIQDRLSSLPDFNREGGDGNNTQ